MNGMKYGLLALAAALVMSGCSIQVSTSGVDNCRYREDRSAIVPTDGATILTVNARAGSLRITGQPGLNQVQVRGTACAATADLVSRIQLHAVKTGQTVHVEAELPSSAGQSPYLDLELQVPATMIARVEDTSGDVEIHRLTGLELHDDSGSIRIAEINGGVRVTDSSGEIEITGVNGNVSIPQDDSGGIRVQTVTGDVWIGQDASGDIDLIDVGGNVTIDADGSGSIAVRDVRGDFQVGRDGSGGIRYDRVSGRVTIPHK